MMIDTQILSLLALGVGSYHRRLVDYQGNVYEYSLKLASGLLLSFDMGFFSSIFRIGGIIHVP
ncbi:MAG: hypothetical protein H3Z53_09435 [archaeon]|nr:hypothetical protein [archaeon]